MENNGKNNLNIRNFSLKWIINLIKNDLNLLGINFDSFYPESKLVKNPSDLSLIDGLIIPDRGNAQITNSVLQVSQGAFASLPIYSCGNVQQT